MRAWNGRAFAALALMVGAICLVSVVYDAAGTNHRRFVSSAQAQPAPIRKLIDWLRGLTLPAGIVKAEGRIEATQIDVSSKYAGEVVDVAVQEGDKVAANQVIARLRSPELEAQLAAAQSGLQSAKAAAAQDAVKAAAAKVDEIKSKIGELTLVSPRAGKVQYQLAHPGDSLAAGAPIVTLIDLGDVYMTVFLRAADAAKLGSGDEARIILDRAPDYVVPANVGFVASDSNAAPKTDGAKDDRAKQMLRVDLKIDPKVVETYYGKVETGLRGAGFVRTRPETKWPSDLQVKLPPAPIAQTSKPVLAPVAQEVAPASAPKGEASRPSTPATAPMSAAGSAPGGASPASGPATETARAGAPASAPAPAPVAEANSLGQPPPEPTPSSRPISGAARAPLPAPSVEPSTSLPAAREAKLAPPAPAISAPLAPAPARAPAAQASVSAKLGPEPRAEFAPESLAQLAGAWTQSAADCHKLFQRSGSALTFRQPVDQFAQAAIVESQRIRLPTGVCRIERASRRDRALELSGECQDSISYTSRTAYIKLRSKNEIVFNPNGDSALDTPMMRCSL
jgi:HlyD family secretion protein